MGLENAGAEIMGELTKHRKGRSISHGVHEYDWKMREQKSRANWLNTENARCHRTVYITMQNVTSKVQIGLSPEMGWYPVSFTIIVNKDVWMCTPGRCSWALFKNCLRPLRSSLHSWCLKSFLFRRLSICYRSCFFHSCIFHSRIFSAPELCQNRTILVQVL